MLEIALATFFECAAKSVVSRLWAFPVSPELLHLTISAAHWWNFECSFWSVLYSTVFLWWIPSPDSHFPRIQRLSSASAFGSNFPRPCSRWTESFNCHSLWALIVSCRSILDFSFGLVIVDILSLLGRKVPQSCCYFLDRCHNIPLCSSWLTPLPS